MTRWCSVSSCCEADVGDHDLARLEPARREREPELRPVERDGERGVDDRSGDLTRRGVDAGREVDGDDRRLGCVHPLDQRRRLGPRRAAKAGPEERVDDQLRVLDRVRLDRVALGLAQQARCDPSVPAVRAAAADDGDAARVREPLEHRRGHGARRRAPSARAPSRETRDTAPPRRASPRRCRAARGSPGQASTTATAEASSRECVIERSIAPAPRCAAQSARRPDSRTDGFGRPTISTSFHAKARATPKPSALPTASLPAKRPA